MLKKGISILIKTKRKEDTVGSQREIDTADESVFSEARLTQMNNCGLPVGITFVPSILPYTPYTTRLLLLYRQPRTISIARPDILMSALGHKPEPDSRDTDD